MDFDSFVLATTTADLGEEPAARGVADAVEFRMDLATAPLDQLASYDGELPLLVTNRADWEGGEASGPDRLARLGQAVEHPAVEAVDVELACLPEAPEWVAGLPERDDGVETGRRLRRRAREHGVAVVASVHDFAGTPPRERLDDLLAAAADAGDVGKLAVTAETRADTLALLAATHDATRSGKAVATMAMGEVGRHTRAVAPVYGSRIGYAPVDPANATAPGQFDLATLADLVERLGDAPVSTGNPNL